MTDVLCHMDIIFKHLLDLCIAKKKVQNDKICMSTMYKKCDLDTMINYILKYEDSSNKYNSIYMSFCNKYDIYKKYYFSNNDDTDYKESLITLNMSIDKLNEVKANIFDLLLSNKEDYNNFNNQSDKLKTLIKYSLKCSRHLVYIACFTNIETNRLIEDFYVAYNSVTSARIILKITGTF